MESKEYKKIGFIDAHFVGVVADNEIKVRKNQKTGKDSLSVLIICPGVKVRFSVPKTKWAAVLGEDGNPSLTKKDVVTVFAKGWFNSPDKYGDKDGAVFIASGASFEIVSRGNGEFGKTGFFSFSFMGKVVGEPVMRKSKAGRNFLPVTLFCDGMKTEIFLGQNDWDYVLGRKSAPALAKGDIACGTAVAWKNVLNSWGGNEEAVLEGTAVTFKVASRKADRFSRPQAGSDFPEPPVIENEEDDGIPF